MTNKNLGRGLSAFLENRTVDQNSLGKNSIIKIHVDSVLPNPFQPRQFFDEENLQSLAKSIKRTGVLQPILVIETKNENYQLVAGERRLRASKIAGVSEIPAILLDVNEKEQLEIAILENIQRENLNPMEEAESYSRLVDEFRYTQEELAEILGKSRSHITNMLRLLQLPTHVKNMLRQEKISFGHARALVGSDEAISIANKIVEQSLSVRQTEDLMKRRKNIDKGSSSDDYYFHRSFDDGEVANLSKKISDLIGLQSKIKLKKTGVTLEVNFKDFEELDLLITKFNSMQ